MFRIVAFILLLMSMAASAQSPIDDWAGRVDLFGRSLPQEKVFLHTDNSCYFLGDTIFYRAYITRSDTEKPSTLSGVLYVELLNADGFLMERQQIEMRGGMGTGTVVLDTATCLYAGYYELRAYTRWMLNWGLTEYPHSRWSETWFYNREMAREYYRDYEKLYSRVLPVYDRPKERGDYARDMTTRPLRRYYKNDDQNKKATVTLYPEGGHLVAGTRNRIAFDALDESGRHLRGTLSITDNKDRPIATAETVNRGRGTIEFTPLAGQKYRCRFKSATDTYSVEMPKVEGDGVALRCSIINNRLSIAVSLAGAAASDTLGLTLMHSGQVRQTFSIDSNDISCPLDSLPAGVIDVTVFNSAGRVWADRLCFNHKSKGDNKIAIKGDDRMCQPYEPITLNLKAPEKATLSLAVMDAAAADDTYDNATMLEEMLLSSEIRGFVEDPGYYFEANDEEHLTALDLLMMVQGWRRFGWRQMAAPKDEGFEILHPYEARTPVMSGSVNRYDAQRREHIIDIDLVPLNSEEAKAKEIEQNVTFNEQTQAATRWEDSYGKLKREVRVQADFVQPGSETLTGECDTEDGRFRIIAPLFDGECYFFLSASDTAHWKKKKPRRRIRKNAFSWVSTDEEALPEFYVKLDHPYPRFTHPYTFYQTASGEYRKRRGTSVSRGTFDDRELDEVTVRVRHGGKRAINFNAPAIRVDAYRAFNYVIDCGLSTGQFIGANRFADDIARAYIGDMGLERRFKLEVRRDHHNKSYYMTPTAKEKYNYLSSLDYVNIYTDFSLRNVGDRRWLGSDQPEVVVDIIKMPNDTERTVFRDRRIVLPGFAIIEDFYHPDYSRMALPDEPDVRRTLYWTPALETDADGSATVTFYRNSRPGELIVTANGFSAKGTILSY